MKTNGKKPDLARIKKAVSFPDLMTRYGFQLKAQGGGSFRGKCPLPTHTRETDDNSFTAALKESGWVWDCFSNSCIANRGGKKGGNMLDFVMAMEKDSSLFRIGTKLNDWFGLNAWLINGQGATTAESKPQARSAATESQPRPAEKPVDTAAASETEPGENKPLGFRLQHIDFKHPYLAQRGITPETAEYFGVGYFPGNSKLLKGRIVFPIWNARGEGNPVAYAGRSIDGSEPKYVFPPGFKKSLELWNLHRIPEAADHVIVLEGLFSVMRFHQAGIRNVVSLMGSSASEEQIRVLAAFSCVTLCLDPDEAGRAATAALLQPIARLTHVRALELPGQADELEPETIRKLLAI
ncbi:MAG: hypothetical protein C5B51_14725 [Terriglobia bacterium]|nr:MAG: hypothetical protein C5B51_14725 [Terriglobia bacterium]